MKKTAGNTQDSELKRPSPNVTSDPFILASLTACIYWFAFLYEKSFLNYFDVPTSLVHVNITLIMICAFTVASFFIFLMPFANLFFLLFWPNSAELRNKAGRVAIILMVPTSSLFLFGYREENLFSYIFVLIYLLVFEFIWPLVTQHDVKGLKNKFIESERSEASTKRKNLGSRIYNKFGITIYVLFLVLVLGSFLCMQAGRANAYKQDLFPVLTEYKHMAVIRIYDNIIVAKPLKHDLSGFKESFSLIPVKNKIDFKNIKLKLKNRKP